jgi:hypothetical protein
MIGYRLAMGKTWSDVKEEIKEYSSSLAIVEFLESKYDPKSWIEYK